VYRQNCWKLNWTVQQLKETKFLRLGEIETPRLLNTILLDNSLHFLMVHFTTLNGQQIRSYDYRNSTGLLNSGETGQTWPSGINQDFGKILPWPFQKLCIQKMPLMNIASRRLLIRPISIHGLVATDFWSQVMMLKWFWTEWIVSEFLRFKA
jgi:hypothetical protein